jgi:hypothetical protein
MIFQCLTLEYNSRFVNDLWAFFCALIERDPGLGAIAEFERSFDPCEDQ